MVVLISTLHYIQFKLIFEKPVDYFEVVLQKQIDLKQKFKIDKKKVIVVDLKNDKRFLKSDFNKKYGFNFNSNPYFEFSFISLMESKNKYQQYKNIYGNIQRRTHNSHHTKYYDMSYEEFEYDMDLMLEEFKLFLDNFELNDKELAIYKAFKFDKKLNSNIRYFYWDDVFEVKKSWDSPESESESEKELEQEQEQELKQEL